MAKKKHEPAQPKQRSAPTFRPMEEKLKKLAAEKRRADEAARQKATAAGAVKAKAKPAPPPQRESTLTRDDELFFRRLMSGVVPLDEDERGRVTQAENVKKPVAAPTTSTIDHDREARDRLMELVEGATRFEVTDDGKRLHGRRLDLSPAVWRRLRDGQMSIDARLDLHGKTSDEARTALETFLRERRTRRDRVALVVHGRGEHSPAGIGVLRGEIAAWLSQGRPSQHVAAFATAREDDGGEGALYVLIRP